MYVALPNAEQQTANVLLRRKYNVSWDLRYGDMSRSQRIDEYAHVAQPGEE